MTTESLCADLFVSVCLAVRLHQTTLSLTLIGAETIEVNVLGLKVQCIFDRPLVLDETHQAGVVTPLVLEELREIGDVGV